MLCPSRARAHVNEHSRRKTLRPGTHRILAPSRFASKARPKGHVVLYSAQTVEYSSCLKRRVSARKPVEGMAGKWEPQEAEADYFFSSTGSSRSHSPRRTFGLRMQIMVRIFFPSFIRFPFGLHQDSSCSGEQVDSAFDDRSEGAT